MKSQYPNITVDPHTDTMEMVLPLNSTASSQRTLRPHPHTCNLQQEQLARSRHAHTHSLTRSVLSFCPVSVLDVASVASKKSSTALHTCTSRPDFGPNKSQVTLIGFKKSNPLDWSIVPSACLRAQIFGF